MIVLIRLRLSRKGRYSTNSEPKFDWNDAFADAAIMSGSSFFSTMAGLGVMGLWGDPVKGFCAGFIAAGVQFFAILSLKRGMIRKSEVIG